MRTKISIIIIALLTLSTALFAVARADTYNGLSLPQKIGEYHIKVNNITNDKFAGLITFFEGRETFDQEVIDALVPPQDMQTDCEQNYSASCLAFELNAEFQNLVESLQEDLERADLNVLQQSGSITGGINSFGLSNEFANEQLQISSKLQKQTMDFYQQTLFAYPLHLQYETTLEELNEFLSNLKDFKNKILIYPSKFHNATTAQCI